MKTDLYLTKIIGEYAIQELYSADQHQHQVDMELLTAHVAPENISVTEYIVADVKFNVCSFHSPFAAK